MEPQATYQLTFEILVLVGSTIAGVIASYKLLTDVVIAKNENRVKNTVSQKIIFRKYSKRRIPKSLLCIRC